jgi:tetratricopeptide (TPR) repeat protein
MKAILKKNTIWPLAICTFIAILSCNGNGNTLDTYISRGQSEFDQGRYRDAVLQWEKALELSPEDDHLNVRIARAYQHLAQFDLSTKYLKHVIEKKNDALNAHLMMIQNELFTGHYQNAQQISASLEMLFSDDSRVKTVNGDIAAFMGNYKEAETLYRLAIAKDGHRSEPFFKLAAILLVQDKKEMAEEFYSRAIDIDEQSTVQHWLHRSAFQALQGNTDRAVSAMREALKLQPNSFFLKIKIAQLLLSHKKYKALIDFIETPGAIDAESKTIQKLYVEALLNTHQLDKASTILKVFERSQDPEWLMLIGKKYLLQESFSIANSYFELVIALRKNDPNAAYMLAMSYLGADKVSLATRTLIRLLAAYPDMVEAELALAIIYYKKEEYDLSIDYLNRIISNAPENPRPYIIIGNCMLFSGQYASAESSFKKALMWDSNSLAARYYLALVKEKSGKWDDAIHLYRSVLSASPVKADVGLRLANLLIKEGRTEEAVELFKQLVSSHPENGYHKLILGNIYRVLHQYDEAAHYYSLALEIAPDLAEAYINLADLQSENAQKVTILKDGLKKVPDSVELLMSLANVHFSDNQFDLAISAMNEAYLITPQDPAVANNLAWLYLETETKLNDAYELAMSAYEKAPQNPSYAHTLGWALHKKGFFRKAEWQFREALKLIDKSKQTSENEQLKAIGSYHLALTLLKTERKNEAIEKLKFAMASGLPPRFEVHARELLESIQEISDDRTQGQADAKAAQDQRDRPALRVSQASSICRRAS